MLSHRPAHTPCPPCSPSQPCTHITTLYTPFLYSARAAPHTFHPLALQRACHAHHPLALQRTCHACSLQNLLFRLYITVAAPTTKLVDRMTRTTCVTVA